jgi:hypothetical protein
VVAQASATAWRVLRGHLSALTGGSGNGMSGASVLLRPSALSGGGDAYGAEELLRQLGVLLARRVLDRERDHMASDDSHDPLRLLSSGSRDLHRALLSLTEELQAIDAYQLRAEVCSDSQLRDVFLHNKNEEIEHATMLMEWLRRHEAHFTETMKTYLLTEAPIVALEAVAPVDGRTSPPVTALGIGSMKEK